MRTTITALSMIVTAGWILAGCGSELTEPMTPRVQSLRAATQAFRELVETHHIEVTSASTPAAINEAEEAHEHATDDRRADILHEVEELGGCANDGLGPHSEGIMAGLSTLQTEFSRHDQAMHDATDMESLMNEESRHRASASAAFDAVFLELDELSGGAAGYLCPMADAHGTAPAHDDGPE